AALAAEQAVKSAAAASMGSMISGAAGGADIHVCATPLPIPPHGPGVVVTGSLTVLINNLAACRASDTIVEAVGPPNVIVMGLPTVIIGG
ncbi:PAAR domain-containing protein, partial [Methylobacterium trifolii]